MSKIISLNSPLAAEPIKYCALLLLNFKPDLSITFINLTDKIVDERAVTKMEKGIC